jgi:CheY-like chemotaxis protein
MARWRKRRRLPDDDGLPEELATLARVLAGYGQAALPAFGAPTKCPVCASYGLVTMDPVARAAHNQCVSCGHGWTITARALRAAREQPQALPLEPSPSALLLPGEPDRSDSLAVDWGPPPDLVPVVIEGGSRIDPAARLAVQAEDLTLLLVEDDPADADLVRMVLEPYRDGAISVLHAETRAEGERLVGRHADIDVVLLDLGLPDSSGLATLSNWRPARPSPPVVVLSGNGNSGLVEASRQMGAALYVHKHDLVDLAGTGDGVDDLVQAFRSLSAAGDRAD